MMAGSIRYIALLTLPVSTFASADDVLVQLEASSALGSATVEWRESDFTHLPDRHFCQCVVEGPLIDPVNGNTIATALHGFVAFRTSTIEQDWSVIAGEADVTVAIRLQPLHFTRIPESQAQGRAGFWLTVADLDGDWGELSAPADEDLRLIRAEVFLGPDESAVFADSPLIVYTGPHGTVSGGATEPPRIGTRAVGSFVDGAALDTRFRLTANDAGAINASFEITPAPFSCLGDLDDDGAVTLQDLANLLANFGAQQADAAMGDCDADFEIGLADLACMLSAFGNSCP